MEGYQENHKEHAFINTYLREIFKMSLLSIISNEEFIEAWTKEALTVQIKL